MKQNKRNKDIISRELIYKGKKREFIYKGKKKGYITFEELNDDLSEDFVSSDEHIDELMMMFEELDILVIDEEKKDKIKGLQKVKTGFLYRPDEPKTKITASIIIPDITDEILNYLRTSPERIYSISPRQFEELIASIFANNGFHVELTPPIKDGGFDVIAVQHDNITGTNVHLIECKRYKPENKVAVGLVRQMLGIVESEKATKGHIVTTSYFTSSAERFASIHKTRLSLSNFDTIISWLNSFPLLNFTRTK